MTHLLWYVRSSVNAVVEITWADIAIRFATYFCRWTYSASTGAASLSMHSFNWILRRACGRQLVQTSRIYQGVPSGFPSHNSLRCALRTSVSGAWRQTRTVRAPYGPSAPVTASRAELWCEFHVVYTFYFENLSGMQAHREAVERFSCWRQFGAFQVASH